MKKITLFLVVIVLMASCKKDSSLSQNASFSGSGGQPQKTATLPTIISDWVSPSFSEAIENGHSFLKGTYSINNPISRDYSDAVRLVYLRTQNGNDYNYLSLPLQYRTANGDLQVEAELTDNKLQIVIHFDNFLAMPNLRAFRDYEFRYLVVPLSIYRSRTIDWSDYSLVAASFNFPK